MKTAKTAKTVKVKQTRRRKAEHRNPRTCYAVSKDKQHVYRFVNHAQRLDFLMRDKLVPIDALTYRAMANADITGKLIYHDMRGTPFNPEPVPIPATSGPSDIVMSENHDDVKALLDTLKTGFASMLSDFGQKLEHFTPPQGQGGTVERLSPSH